MGEHIVHLPGRGALRRRHHSGIKQDMVVTVRVLQGSGTSLVHDVPQPGGSLLRVGVQQHGIEQVGAVTAAEFSLLQPCLQLLMDVAEKLVGPLAAKDLVDELELTDIQRRQIHILPLAQGLLQLQSEAAQIVAAGEGVVESQIAKFPVVAAGQAIAVHKQYDHQQQQHRKGDRNDRHDPIKPACFLHPADTEHIPILDVHRLQQRLIAAALAAEGGIDAFPGGQGCPNFFRFLTAEIGFFIDGSHRFFHNGILGMDQQFALGVEQMVVAVAGKHGVAAQDVREYLHLIAGDQCAHCIAVPAHRDGVNENFLLRQFALDQVGQRHLSLPGLGHDFLHLRLHLRQFHIAAHRLTQNGHNARPVQREIGHGHEIVPQVCLVQDLVKVFGLVHIAELEKAGHGGQDLIVRTHLLFQPVFVFIGLCAHLVFGDLDHGTGQKRRHPFPGGKQQQSCGHDEHHCAAKPFLQTFFFHFARPLSQCQDGASGFIIAHPAAGCKRGARRTVAEHQLDGRAGGAPASQWPA